jgi:hypothetical protein
MPVVKYCRYIRSLTTASLLLALSGCQIFGLVAYAIPKYIPAQYAGLKDQSVAVMVWTDPGLRVDWGTKLQIDLASAIQRKLQTQAATGKVDDLKGTTFPINPLSVVRYQRDHPEVETMPITEVVPKFGVSRVVYVELTQFNTQSSDAVTLYRGSATANLRVVEITGDQGKIAYSEDNIQVVFPPKSPPEGTPNGSVERMYAGTMDELSTTIARKFYKYDSDQ